MFVVAAQQERRIWMFPKSQVYFIIKRYLNPIYSMSFHEISRYIACSDRVKKRLSHCSILSIRCCASRIDIEQEREHACCYYNDDEDEDDDDGI